MPESDAEGAQAWAGLCWYYPVALKHTLGASAYSGYRAVSIPATEWFLQIMTSTIFHHPPKNDSRSSSSVVIGGSG
jgi:hypothetical protein